MKKKEKKYNYRVRNQEKLFKKQNRTESVGFALALVSCLILVNKFWSPEKKNLLFRTERIGHDHCLKIFANLLLNLLGN